MGKRRDSFIEEAGNPGKGGFMSQRTNSLLSIREQKVLKEHFRGLQAGVLCAKQQGHLQQSSWNWSCGGLISVILIVLRRVNLQFQNQFVPISLSPILRTVAAYVMVIM